MLKERRIIAVGVSAILYDDWGFAFQVTDPRNWGWGVDHARVAGIGGIGARLAPGTGPLACLRRGVREAVGADFWVEPTDATALIRNGEVAGWLDLPASADRAVPFMVSLLPPQLERSDRPDHLAIVSYRGVLRQVPRRRNVFGLLRIERSALETFFARPEWEADEALAHPWLELDLASPLPTNAVIRPTLSARAFQVFLEHRPPRAAGP